MARRPIPILAPADWCDGKWTALYGLPSHFNDEWSIAWAGSNDAGSVVVAYTIRGWCAFAIGNDGLIERWTDADSGRAGVGTCTDAGKERSIAAARAMLDHLVGSEVWLRPSARGPGEVTLRADINRHVACHNCVTKFKAADRVDTTDDRAAILRNEAVVDRRGTGRNPARDEAGVLRNGAVAHREAPSTDCAREISGVPKECAVLNNQRAGRDAAGLVLAPIVGETAVADRHDASPDCASPLAGKVAREDAVLDEERAAALDSARVEGKAGDRAGLDGEKLGALAVDCADGEAAPSNRAVLDGESPTVAIDPAGPVATTRDCAVANEQPTGVIDCAGYCGAPRDGAVFDGERAGIGDAATVCGGAGDPAVLDHQIAAVSDSAGEKPSVVEERAVVDREVARIRNRAVSTATVAEAQVLQEHGSAAIHGDDRHLRAPVQRDQPTAIDRRIVRNFQGCGQHDRNRVRAASESNCAAACSSNA